MAAAKTPRGKGERASGAEVLSDLLTELLAQPDGPAALDVLLRYILATHEHIDRQKLRRAVVEAIGARAVENVVTVYEQLIEEGRQKGLRQGIEKGRTQGRAEGCAQGRAEGRTQGRAEGCAKMLLDLLVAKFGSVPAGVRDRIQGAGEGELAAWATRVLTAATLEDALGPVTASPAARRAPRPRR